jgi:hypothetical protein
LALSRFVNKIHLSSLVSSSLETMSMLELGGLSDALGEPSRSRNG